jgi:16S rRNA (uracil1498-N3)-methyltransferase
LTPRLLVRNAGEALGGEDEPTLIRLPREQAHYLTRVLRLTEGSALEVFDGAGARYLARLAQAGGEGCRISMAQCLSSADKMDWTIEKAVELGVRRIIPLFSERSPVRFDAQRATRKREHWQAIIEAACMQCGEDRLPELLEPSGLHQWLSGTSSLDALRLVLSPTGSLSLVECVSTSGCADPSAGTGFPAQGARPIELLVGPESGLSETEVALATRAGWQPVRLGPRVLRTETAGLAALAAIAAIAGDFR